MVVTERAAQGGTSAQAPCNEEDDEEEEDTSYALRRTMRFSQLLGVWCVCMGMMGGEKGTTY